MACIGTVTPMLLTPFPSHGNSGDSAFVPPKAGSDSLSNVLQVYLRCERVCTSVCGGWIGGGMGTYPPSIIQVYIISICHSQAKAWDWLKRHH